MQFQGSRVDKGVRLLPAWVRKRSGGPARALPHEAEAGGGTLSYHHRLIGVQRVHEGRAEMCREGEERVAERVLPAPTRS